MPVHEYSEAVELVRDQMLNIESEFIETLEVEQQDSPNFPVLLFNRTGHTAGIAAVKDKEFFLVYYPLNIDEELGESLADESLNHTIENFNISADTEEERKRLAGLKLLESINRSDMERFEFHLSERISTTGLTTYGIRTAESGVTRGYEVTSKIFPYEYDYSLSDLETAVRAVLTDGVRGLRYVNHTFDLTDIEDGSATAELNLDFK